MKCDVYAYALLSDCKYVIAILKHPFLPAALDHVISKCFLVGHGHRLPLVYINNAPLLSYSNPTPLGLYRHADFRETTLAKNSALIPHYGCVVDFRGIQLTLLHIIIQIVASRWIHE